MPRILHVDDEEAEHQLLAANLARHIPELEIVWTGMPQELCEEDADLAFDCILCDYQMPGMDGLELLLELRKRGIEIPFIFLTGQGNEEVASEALHRGADDYFTKEVGFAHYERLANSIEKLMESKRRRDQRREAEAKLQHLNLVLRALRGVNQLITKEHDIDKLINGACDILTRTRGYYYVLIALKGESDKFCKIAGSCLTQEEIDCIENDLCAGALPPCLEVAIEASGVKAIEDLSSMCGQCPNCRIGPDAGAFRIRLEYEGCEFGLMQVALDSSLVTDIEEQELFEEVARDISFALHRNQLEDLQAKAQSDLVESEERYRSVAEDAPIMLCRYLPGGEILYANEAYCEYFGQSCEELVGRSFLSLIPEEDHSEVLANIEALTPDAPTLSHEHQVITPGGETRWHRWTNRALFDREDLPIAYQSFGEDITEKRELMQALQDNEKRFRLAAQVSNDLIFEWDVASGSVEWFGDLDGLLGYPPGTIPGTVEGWAQHIHPDEIERLRRAAEHHSQNPEPINDEYRLIHADGSIRVWYATGLPVTDETGRPVEWIGTCTDITEKKKREEAVHTSREQFRAWLEDAPVPALLHSEGKLVFINRAALREFGSDSAESVLGNNPLDFIHPDYRDTIRDRITKTYAKRDVARRIEAKMLREDGTAFSVEAYVAPVDYEGKGASLVFFQNITSQKEAEKALAESEEKFRSLVESTTDWIWEVDTEGRYTYTNPRVKSLLGYEPEEVLGIMAFEFMPPGEAERVKVMFDEAVAERVPLEKLENVVLGKNGRVMVLETSGIPIFDASGKLVGYRGIDRDITDLKRSRRQLEAANKDLEAFAYTVSHDLRAPLRHITGFTEVLKEKYIQEIDKDGRKLIERIINAGERMDQMINDILSLSRASRTEMKAEEIDLSEIFHSISDESASAVPGREIEARIEDGLSARGDPGLIRQVLQNLFDNAVKFTRGRDKAVIEFGAEKKRGERVFFVRDNGIGFSDEQADRIFEPFRRLSKDSELEGSGIGLATVKRIVQRHGGRIWAKGDPDKGATFFFALSGD